MLVNTRIKPDTEERRALFRVSKSLDDSETSTSRSQPIEKGDFAKIRRQHKPAFPIDSYPRL